MRKIHRKYLNKILNVKNIIIIIVFITIIILHGTEGAYSQPNTQV